MFALPRVTRHSRIEAVQIFIVGSFVVACTVKVARLPRSGESVDAAAFLSEPGGKGFNLALACHRLGAHVGGVFVIGDDAFSEIAVATFQQVGLAQAMLVRRPGSTGAGVGFVDTVGENCLAVSLGVNGLMAAGDVEARFADLDRGALVMATFESPDAPIQSAFARARARGTATLLNPSPMRAIDPRILADTAILVVNRVEAEDLGLEDALDADGRKSACIDALMGMGPDTIVITKGEAGAVLFRRGLPACHQPAFRVPVVDTIGAGDAFTAGFGTAVLESRSIEDALRRASACGALTTSRFGAFEAFPSGAELDRFLLTGDDRWNVRPSADGPSDG